MSTAKSLCVPTVANPSDPHLMQALAAVVVTSLAGGIAYYAKRDAKLTIYTTLAAGIFSSYPYMDASADKSDEDNGGDRMTIFFASLLLGSVFTAAAVMRYQTLSAQTPVTP